MNFRRIIINRPLINLFTRTHTLHPFTTTPTNPSLHQSQTTLLNNSLIPVNSDHLLRVCTILFQQQDASDSKLQTHLQKTQFSLNHEFFLQVCNKFPLSWRPVYRFYQFTLTCPEFTHTSVSFNKMLDVVGKSKNIDLFWELLHEVTKQKMTNDKTFRIALKVLASARELKKCVEYFHLMNSHGYGYSLDTLNKVVETLCKENLVEEAKFVVVKLKDWIKPNQVTYKHLICGFCDTGDVIEASKLWNLMVDEGIEAEIDAVNTMIERFFKNNQFDQGLKLFQTMRVKRMEEVGLSMYSIVIKWMCKRGKLSQAQLVFEELQKRGIKADNATLASIIYGLLSKNRVQEAYLIMENTEKPDISMYHALIKGLLKSRKAGEATEVFRLMIKKGCEPIMHTYILLLQGHLGKRGRKGNDPLVNFDSIFVGGLVKAGKVLEATNYTERTLNRGLQVPRFDYNKFLHYYSNDEGVFMFEEVGKKLREVGLFDLADIFLRYGEKMATRDRRRTRESFE
ncbi:putative pentatricopeptide repeat-containing protein At1g26500 [Spinacia oleracea]|uniref:Pentatricopeptide repeat-containing protein At1g26500 n=1 Tax=Spinacia oleracea TaxID=3562 RepID=A0ABM3RNT6_SPIOL|nr:putative pentatricopeptide repeat-containing protein At1g26500 [Spinacia oleracea]XP_056697289.1 putative pentatricopeptide repeat-containing protein At1g26500 [Spinacia oleracea]XP_056697290.1 putative pentatricopeptide repeat-containing protein At1g26500 [Spinacia oleracea]XP_056697291.1 putative pentatricopeptide repeat-containing protein At1g26500 [Spinacia oleracea]XP_056697292.1 putative pentatricopeptide repeat-containing protein At1g26500 [Spinacia oleracea]